MWRSTPLPVSSAFGKPFRHVKKLFATRLTEVLILERLNEEKEQNQRLVKVPTEKGFAQGIEKRE